MKLLGILIAVENPTDKQIYIKVTEYELSSISYFKKGTAKETFKFVTRNSLPTLQLSTRHQIPHEAYTIYIQMDKQKKIGAFAFVDGEYPSRIIYECLQKCLQAFDSVYGQNWKNINNNNADNIQEIKDLLQKYQDPTKCDNYNKAQQTIDQIKVTMHDNIEQLLENQGNIDELVEKSSDLNKVSKTFYKQAKKADKKCCVIF